MIEVAEALRLVLTEAVPWKPAIETAAAYAVNGVLAEDIFSDFDSPPHDKSIVDGFAVRAADCASAPVELEVVEQVTAGQVPTRTVGPSQATRIMTGAPIPDGADAVVMVEKTEIPGRPNRVRILQSGVRPNQNIVRRGQSMRKGDRVLASGKRLRAADVGLLSEVGRKLVKCIWPPTVFVVVTGNELVPVEQSPGPGQIRNSNGPMLAALARECHAMTDNGEAIANDDEAALQSAIQQRISDVLILSGGVSEGVLDLVPRVLSDLGVRQVFHKVNLKPGKPIWFGVKEHEDGRRTLVFGLPGNPVSSLVCFQLFVRPALEKLAGREPRGMECFSARLAKPFTSRGERPTYWPGAFHHAERDGYFVEPLPWQGSGDLRTLADADCLIFFPPGQQEYTAGEAVTAYRL